MKLGIVIGNIISTRKTGGFGGLKLLVVRSLSELLEETDRTIACVDTVGAGEGDIVLLCSSSSARMTERTRSVATDVTIVGIVDSVTMGNSSRSSTLSTKAENGARTY